MKNRIKNTGLCLAFSVSLFSHAQTNPKIKSASPAPAAFSKSAVSTSMEKIEVNGIVKATGNITTTAKVGIGTNRPLAFLHIMAEKEPSSKGGILLENNAPKGKKFSIASRTDGQNDTALFAIADEDTPGGITRFMIAPEGNIGIGTTAPDEKLTVKGAVHSEEVRVDLLVPADYVFEKYYTGASVLKGDYTMPTLKEVAAFTQLNHHLPEMPSAKQMQQEGVKLGEMSNLLLQKTEELTLYMIEQQQQIDLLKQQNMLLQQQIEALTDKLNK